MSQENPYLVMLTNVRASFPTLMEPKASTKDGPLKYSCDFLLGPQHPDLQKFFAVVNKVAVDKWKEQAAAVMQMVNNERKFRCYGRGEERINQKKMVPYDGYPGNLYITGLSNTQPIIVLPDGSPAPANNTMVLNAEIRKIYGGCYVNACIKMFPQNNDKGRAIRCELVAIQFLADGEPFGEGPIDVTGMFGAVAGAPAATGFGAIAEPAPSQGMPVPPQYADPQPQGLPPAPTGQMPGFSLS
jgi:hypothetical protein